MPHLPPLHKEQPKQINEVNKEDISTTAMYKASKWKKVHKTKQTSLNKELINQTASNRPDTW